MAKMALEMRIPSGAKARVLLRCSMYGLKPVPFIAGELAFVARLKSCLFEAWSSRFPAGLK